MTTNHSTPQLAARRAGAYVRGASASDNVHVISPTPDAVPNDGLCHADDGAGVEFWAELFGAVLERLHHAVDAGAGDAAHADRTRGVVLECAAAMGQLRATLVDEAARLRASRRLPGPARGDPGAHARGHHGGAAAVPDRRSRPRGLPLGGPLQPDPGFLESRLQLAVADAASNGQFLALLQLGLDGLDRVVADHGRDAADKVRRIVAERLGRSVRAADIVCSAGSDGFTIVFAGLPDRETVSHLAAKLLDAVSPALKAGALSLTVRPGIGIALYPGDGCRASDLIQVAASAMHWALEQRAGYAYADELEPRTAGGTEDPQVGGANGSSVGRGGAAPFWNGMSPLGADGHDFTEPPGSADAMLAAFGDSGGIARGDDLARVLDRLERSEPLRLSALVASGQVFGFEWHRVFWVPMFQFELDSMALKPGAGVALSELRAVFSGWELASWFCQPNSSLGGRRPVDVVDSDVAALRDAARIDRFVAAG